MAGLIRLAGGQGVRPGPPRVPGKLSTTDRDAGMITAEIAVGLLAVTVVLGMMIYAIGVGIAHVRTQESARAGARSAARGDTNSAIVTTVKQSLPGAKVRITRRGATRGGRVTVIVSTRTKPLLALPSMEVSSRSVADAEPR
ncbi:MAG: hypothetical protein ACJAY5_000012 [Actinomycetes bacterium]|jgi:hypothetical protein